MHVNSVNRDRVAVGRIAGVVLLIALLMGLAALTSSPLLHLRLCPNANRPDHHCAVTDFGAGLAEVPVAAALCLAVLAVVFACLPEPAICRRAALPYRLSPSRAPPSTLSFAG